MEEVTIENGIIRGKVVNHAGRIARYYAFEGIPYAKPPINELRFQDPVPCDDWEGVLDCTQFRKIPHQIQTESQFESMQNEDCLYINVFTSELPQEERRIRLPVIFFIYGGAFMNGHASPEKKGPGFFIDHQVIVVTFNYRVGPFGFLSTEDGVIKGNFGLKDQLLALHWVNRNIRHFGGDPEKVTIYGQGAGAVSVCHLLLNRQAEGLFRAAIAASGSVLNQWSFRKNAKDYAYKMGHYINPTISAETTSSADLLQFLKVASVEDIMRAARRIYKEESRLSQYFRGFVFGPVLESPIESYFETLVSGKASRVPLMIGITSEELLREAEEPETFLEEMRHLDNNLELLVPSGVNIRESSNNDLKLMVGKQIREMYTKSLFHRDLCAAIKFCSDAVMNRGIIKHAELQSKFSTVYFYQFSYRGRLGGNPLEIDGIDKVAHSEDNQYLWTNPSNRNVYLFPEEDQRIQDLMLRYITNFCKCLNPTPREGQCALMPVWQPVSFRGEKFVYIDINSTTILHESYPKVRYFKAWNGIFLLHGRPPFVTF